MAKHCNSFEAHCIINGNLKLILGMIWTLILRFMIADIKYDVSLESFVFCDKYANLISYPQVKKASLH